jgi:ComF family protein
LSYVDQGAALFPYTGNYRNLLRAYKFEGCRRLGNFLAEKILEGLSCFSAPLSRDAVLVPVPPKPGKLKKIGWDQIDYIAKILKRRFRETRSFRVYPCLKRLSFQSQKGLNREDRKTNLLGRIRPVRKAPREAVLFDDVITTGATLDACAAALKDGGAEKVYGICLFY